jgi:hypothetical protein
VELILERISSFRALYSQVQFAITNNVAVVVVVIYVAAHGISAFMARRDRAKESYDALLREIQVVQAMLYRRLAQESFDERVQGYVQDGFDEADAMRMADQISGYQRDRPS